MLNFSKPLCLKKATSLFFSLFIISFGTKAQFKITKSEFIFDKAPFAECHASTIAETKLGLVSAWFGGTEERNKDVEIWLSRLEKENWSAPISVANGIENDSLRYPCWNPVLYQIPDGELLLFYKIGPSPSTWWGMLKRSIDDGRTWSIAEKLPIGIFGPIKNKPVLLNDGKTLLLPTSTEDNGWRVHFESTNDWGKSWQKTTPVNDGKQYSAIQPSVLFLKNGDLKILCRSKNDFILESTSKDKGQIWSQLKPTKLSNPSSGTDAVTLKNGKHVLVYNPTTWESRKTNNDREKLSIAISKNAKDWKPIIELENETFQEFSYPAIIQTADNKIHITYTWKRLKIKHVVLEEN